MNAAELASALGGHRVGRRWRAPCPVHGGRSLEIRDSADGKILLHCFGGCSQVEVIDALRGRRLWLAPSLATPSSRPIADPFPETEFRAPTSPACCTAQRDSTQPPCEHWLQFDADMTLARLYDNLREAAGELIIKARRGVDYRCESRDPVEPLSADELRNGLAFAAEFGSIIPLGVDAAAASRAIEIVVGKVAEVQVL